MPNGVLFTLAGYEPSPRFEEFRRRYLSGWIRTGRFGRRRFEHTIEYRTPRACGYNIGIALGELCLRDG